MHTINVNASTQRLAGLADIHRRMPIRIPRQFINSCRLHQLRYIVPGVVVTKSSPSVTFCQVGVSHIQVTESLTSAIFKPTRVSHIYSDWQRRLVSCDE
jgi:hypothetical protein